MGDLDEVSRHRGKEIGVHTIVRVMCRIRYIGLQKTSKLIRIVESCHVEREAGIISDVIATQRFNSQKLKPIHIGPLE